MASEFQIPDPQHVNSTARLIIRANGLANVKPKFFQTSVSDNEESERKLGDADKHLSQFGLPVFDALEFPTLTYDYDKTEDGVTKKYTQTITTLTIATVLIEVSMSRNIVATPVSGRNGTVKEYVSDGDHMITIRGVLVGNGIDVHPEDEKRHLLQFCKAPKEIGVASDLLLDFEIKSIVIKDYNFGQMEGKRNVVPFELLCLSETPFEIQQKDA